MALWIVNVLAAAAFVAIGLAKFGLPEWAINFERWGYPDGSTWSSAPSRLPAAFCCCCRGCRRTRPRCSGRS